MAEQVKVEDLEVFRLFRAAMLKFAQAVEQAISGADSEIGRTHSWLENEQTSFWQSQLRKRTEAVTAARDAVRQKKLYKDASGRTPGAVEEEKALARCLAAVEQAEHKIEAVRRWIPRLEKEAEIYRSGVARLSASVNGEIPQAVALLDRLAARLEEYVQIEVPAGAAAEAAAPALEGEAVVRGGEAAAEPPVKVGEAAPGTTTDGRAGAAPGSGSEAGPRKEGRDVADGK